MCVNHESNELYQDFHFHCNLYRPYILYNEEKDVNDLSREVYHYSRKHCSDPSHGYLSDGTAKRFN